MEEARSPIEEVVACLAAAGFVGDGATRTEQVRVPTKDSPVYGKSGGELVTYGGRMRFAKAGTRIKATVGKRTTAIYEVTGPGLAGVRGIASVETRDIERIRATLRAL
ncbi:hypothetical protein [Paracidovorax citrulli]|uniref:hypothetical protein n=1 Tax=Paracidovorax citrulli TaxID=80869 RepID=UPI003FA7C04B